MKTPLDKELEKKFVVCSITRQDLLSLDQFDPDDIANLTDLEMNKIAAKMKRAHYKAAYKNDLANAGKGIFDLKSKKKSKSKK